MHKVVSNTTPIISLLKISRLEILKEIYSEIIIPEAVFEEVEAGKGKSYYQDLSELPWVKIKRIKENKLLTSFSDLDAGEAEAIILAKDIDAHLIIMDEKPGRAFAKQSGLKVTGTIGVLVKAKSSGLIQKLRPLLIDLTEKNVWIDKRLIAEVCKLVKE